MSRVLFLLCTTTEIAKWTKGNSIFCRHKAARVRNQAVSQWEPRCSAGIWSFNFRIRSVFLRNSNVFSVTDRSFCGKNVLDGGFEAFFSGNNASNSASDVSFSGKDVTERQFDALFCPSKVSFCENEASVSAFEDWNSPIDVSFLENHGLNPRIDVWFSGKMLLNPRLMLFLHGKSFEMQRSTLEMLQINLCFPKKMDETDDSSVFIGKIIVKKQKLRLHFRKIETSKRHFETWKPASPSSARAPESSNAGFSRQKKDRNVVHF